MSKIVLFVVFAAVILGGAWFALDGNIGTEKVPEPTAADIAFADTATPANPELTAVYDRSCRSCHALDGTGAPLTGFAPDWTARLNARGGLGALVASARNGFEEMPAMGLCNDCSDTNFEELISFMMKGQN
ncbi:hypothetical protein GCM10007094_17920 [Pseudovibrio japonicus]|uniref:Cytochrome c domain-containing protein n=1 Tax=Pseudovibrio japonicus TaxID=366534 RepID=A0ABQ3EGC1_9HYPH|nr:c-type cytochrome [Pseudovibrio japonicus]GHB29953.1 hypothetical protein GCM10007094_17920 [Pseudovibrio japonicus]